MDLHFFARMAFQLERSVLASNRALGQVWESQRAATEALHRAQEARNLVITQLAVSACPAFLRSASIVSDVALNGAGQHVENRLIALAKQLTDVGDLKLPTPAIGGMFRASQRSSLFDLSNRCDRALQEADKDAFWERLHDGTIGATASLYFSDSPTLSFWVSVADESDWKARVAAARARFVRWVRSFFGIVKAAISSIAHPAEVFRLVYVVAQRAWHLRHGAHPPALSGLLTPTWSFGGPA